MLEAKGDFRQEKIAQAYVEYQKELKKNNALDFDDLLVKTVELFQSCPDVLEYYQEPFSLHHGGRVSGHQYRAVQIDQYAGSSVP